MFKNPVNSLKDGGGITPREQFVPSTEDVASSSGDVQMLETCCHGNTVCP